MMYIDMAVANMWDTEWDIYSVGDLADKQVLEQFAKDVEIKA